MGDMGEAACGGVGILAKDTLVPYSIPPPTKDYLDAYETGRCAIYCLDLGGCTLVCGVIYGWTGGTNGSIAADRTDDIFTIMLDQFKLLPHGPKLIAGGINGNTGNFPTVIEMLEELG